MLRAGIWALAVGTIHATPPAAAKWHYTTFAGFEVLSDCDDFTTTSFMSSVYRGLPLMAMPREFQPPPGLPLQIILSKELLPEALSPDDGPDDLIGLRQASHSLYYAAVEDTDVAAVRVNLSAGLVLRETNPVTVSARFVPFILNHHTPKPPEWVIEGFRRLWISDGGSGRISIADTSIHFPGLEGLETTLRDARGRPDKLSSFDELFVHRGPPPGSAARLRWAAETALFVRWCMVAEGAARREKLWTFVARVCAAPPTPEMFREVFGENFEDVRRRLSRYIETGLGEKVTVRLNQLPPPADMALQPASPAQTVRLLAGWDRMQGVALRREHPQLSALYFAEATRRVAGAGGAAAADPGFLAERGLLHFDRGEEEAARVWLEKAATAGVLRPRAQLALARLRFAAAQAEPQGHDGKLDKWQTVAVLRPLFIAHEQPPPLVETYQTLVEVLQASAARPDAEMVQLLRGRVRAFPYETALALSAAEMSAAKGYPEAAREIAAHGVRFTGDPEMRAKLEEMLRALSTTKP